MKNAKKIASWVLALTMVAGTAPASFAADAAPQRPSVGGGGGGHKTGMQGGAYREIETVARHHYKNAVEKYRWATQDCMTLDKVPYIGRYSRSTENLYVATGFNKWGMSSSMAAACILCDEIVGKKSDFAAVFSPSRSICSLL